MGQAADLGRGQCTHANAAVRTILLRVLLAVGDVLQLIDNAVDPMARTVHRIKPGRSAPRKPDLAKRHPSLAYRAGGA